MEKVTIADSLKPTFENVTREFFIDTMYKILFSDKLPNFKFNFRENEAIEFIEKVLQDYSSEYDFYKEKAHQILESIKQKNDDNETQPVMIVNDYKKFFELLRRFYEKDIELYFKRTQRSSFPVWEMRNCFEQIWLRATPEDFNDPEAFLQKQVQMIEDNTFEKYDKETCLGKLSCFDNNILCIQNSISRTWDENSREIVITIYDKDYYNNNELFFKPQYALPVIRYGIYSIENKKICQISSIQNKNNEDKKEPFHKSIERKKYQLNADVPKEKTNTEPKKLLALSIFIDLLSQEGITDIKVPGMYVLDYEYHQKRNLSLMHELKKEWPKSLIAKDPKGYEKYIKEMKKSYNKEDLISKIKTEDVISLFERLLYHYPNGSINIFPGELDNYLHIHIPPIKKKDITGDALREIHTLIEQKYMDVER